MTSFASPTITGNDYKDFEYVHPDLIPGLDLNLSTGSCTKKEKKYRNRSTSLEYMIRIGNIERCMSCKTIREAEKLGYKNLDRSEFNLLINHTE